MKWQLCYLILQHKHLLTALVATFVTVIVAVACEAASGVTFVVVSCPLLATFAAATGPVWIQ